MMIDKNRVVEHKQLQKSISEQNFNLLKRWGEVGSGALNGKMLEISYYKIRGVFSYF